ncbi:MAG: heparin lyase I family protein [Verrucomicrobiota bacterium]
MFKLYKSLFRLAVVGIAALTGDMSSMGMAQTVRLPLDYIAKEPYQWGGAPVSLYGTQRSFNFNGNQPFVNPSTGKSDIATMQYNGTLVVGDNITNTGTPTSHINKFLDTTINENVLRVQLFPQDNLTANSHRTQINSYPILPYKTYAYDLEFKLDPSWNFNMPSGKGLIWQLKGVPKAGQYGNPTLALNIVGNQLSLNLCYPTSAVNATSWPTSVRWGVNEYVKVNIPTRSLVAGKYHRVRVIFYADERPDKFGGQGFLTAWFDEQPWFDYSGPTLQPDLAGPHIMGFGWYQYDAAPTATRKLFFRTNRLYELN